MILETRESSIANDVQRASVLQPSAGFSVLHQGRDAGTELMCSGAASAAANKQTSLDRERSANGAVGAADGTGNRPDVCRGGSSYQIEEVVDLTADSDDEEVYVQHIY